VYGVIFLFKYISSQTRSSEPSDGKFDRDASENIFFAQQTIQNACGTQALLSVVLNQDEIDVGDGLREFKDFTVGLTPDVSQSSISMYTELTEHDSFEETVCPTMS
jgi:ubiquitin carboxyl-terminal hydrolase L5